MREKETVNRMLSRFGESVTIREKDKITNVFAVIQPLLYKNKMYIDGKALDGGYYDGGRYLMIASADVGIEDYRSAVVEYKNAGYKIKRVEVISSGDCDLYIWAVLSPCSDTLEDDYAEFNKCA